eukprot:CAMPEP_0201545142 /NCGR_PEP_ID=MMETSP0173_2-20130828/1676_1 /ASSEMBLY_ACC=CAM_ASM_000268 /TAXON_ID=218659 /ORGANISM="Vexillifera sp., Strain DIVA3 564/2" /LENGTH=333 /DNA_ID=CAMNT_0047953463 /DNA_START=48 /DNA_END=1046 /DNA_ORIENTATION=+
MSGWGKKIGKGFSRTKHSIVTSIGGGHATQDPEFNKARDEYKKYCQQVKKIQSTTKRFVQAITAMHKAQHQLANEFTKLYNDFGPVEGIDMGATGAKVKNVSEQLENTKNAIMIEKLNQIFLNPIDRYAKELHEVDKRIDHRNTLATDMDRYQRRLQGTDPTQAAQAQEKADQATQAYQAANNALLADLPYIVSHRGPIVNALMATLSQVEQEYFSSCGDVLETLLNDFSSVDTSVLDSYSPLEGLPGQHTTATSTGAAPSSAAASQQGGAPTAHGGYGAAPPAHGGYGAAPPAHGGYGAAPTPQQGGAPPAHGGYGAAPPARGGYGGAPPSR